MLDFMEVFLGEEVKIYKRTGCSPSSSDITIRESVSSRGRGSDLGTGFIT